MAKHGDYLKYQLMTSVEVAHEMGSITVSGVDALTRSAMRKLRRNPILFLHWLESSQERKSQNVGTEE